jgi:uncharacterized metal-binding protein
VPGGREHSVATLAVAGGAFAYMASHGFPMSETVDVAIGCLSGLVLTPDLDVDSGSISHKIIDRYFGVIIGFVWRIITKPYAIVFPHRSFFSHFPVVGTAIRVGYFLALAWLLSFLVPLPTPPCDVFLRVFAGLCFVDGAHILMDIFWK